MLNLGAADNRQIINNDGGCGEMRPRVGPNQWRGRCMTPPAQARGLAEQRQSKLVGEVGVRAKALQQRAGLL
jgi:hypothetical protein